MLHISVSSAQDLLAVIPRKQHIPGTFGNVVTENGPQWQMFEFGRVVMS